MKGKIRIILDELRDIERTEGLGAITEGKINEICKAQGVSFDEFKSSILKMLAEEAGISLDELNSFLLEEIGELEKISELDLDKISGGASVSDTVKRGAASLMAILNLSGMSNSYAGMPNSAKVRRDCGAVISKSKVVLSKEEIAEKWVKRLGASAAGAALILAVIGLNNLKNKENNASGDNDEGDSLEAPVVLPGGNHGREAEPGEQPEWKTLFKDDSRLIAAKLGSSDGPTKYFVHLSNNDQPDKFHLRIVGSANEGKTVLISDAFWCADENKRIANHTADADIIKKWEDTKVFVYESIDELNTDGIISRLQMFYRKEMKSFCAAPTKPAKPAGDAKKTSNPRSGLPSNDVDTKTLAGEIYDFEHELGGTKDEKIKKSKKERLALQLSDGDFETRQKEMTAVSKKLLDLKKKSEYFNKTQKQNWQCKFASTVCPEFFDVFQTFGFSEEFDDLALGIIGTENMDYHLKEYYWRGGMLNDRGTHHGKALPSGRTSGRYARLYRDANGKLCALKKTPDEVMNARARMILNLNLKTLTMNGKKNDICPNLLNTISQNKSMIDQLAKEIQNMNAYHQCSGDVFEKMLGTGSVVSMDQLLDPLVAKNDKEKLKIMWDSLSAPSCEKPNEAFSKLMDNYNKADGVANFLKACVGNGLERILRLSGTEKVVSGIPIKTLRLSVKCFKDVGSADSGSVPSALQQEAQLVKKYMEKANDSTLVNINAGGLGAEQDAKAGTNTTVFSILGGNKMAIEEYALKFKKSTESIGSRKGCIIEIPNRCVSYVSPYALLLDVDSQCIASNINSKKDSYAVVNGKDNGIQINMNGIDMNINNGLIALADSPYVNVEVEWASSIGRDKYKQKYRGTTDANRQISQMLRSRKLNPSNDMCATALAIYMFCQYVILNDGRIPKNADEVLETSYQMVGSHACMEGHSPGEIPLGGGGIERVLMIGYDETKDKEVIKEARDQGLRVNCIKEVPQTRKELIAAFEGCE